MIIQSRIRRLVLCLATLYFALPSFAQNDKPPMPEKKVQFTPFPYFNYNTTLKFYYGLGGLFTFRTNQADVQSPRSTAGAIYFRTTNGSWYSGLFGQLYFKEDTWRLTAATGTGLFNLQTFMELPGVEEGQFYDYATKTVMFNTRLLRRVSKQDFVGVGYFYNKKKVAFDQLGIDSVATNNSLQLIYLNDSRNSVYYPTHGNKAQVMYTAYPVWLGNGKNFGILNANFNKYIAAAGGRDVWALRAFAKVGSPGLDFQRQVIINGIDLRGYADGKYRGDGMIDVQAEYRWNFAERVGVVGFGGIATLYGSDIEEFNKKLYPSIGTGLRYTLVPSTNMRVGFDVARGKDDFAFYFRIGEAF